MSDNFTLIGTESKGKKWFLENRCIWGKVVAQVLQERKFNKKFELRMTKFETNTKKQKKYWNRLWRCCPVDPSASVGMTVGDWEIDGGCELSLRLRFGLLLLN